MGRVQGILRVKWSITGSKGPFLSVCMFYSTLFKLQKTEKNSSFSKPEQQRYSKRLQTRCDPAASCQNDIKVTSSSHFLPFSSHILSHSSSDWQWWEVSATRRGALTDLHHDRSSVTNHADVVVDITGPRPLPPGLWWHESCLLVLRQASYCILTNTFEKKIT